MPNEPSLGEVVRRLDRMEARLEELVREMGLRVVSAELYARDQRELERRFTELERDLAQERADRETAIRELKTQQVQQGTNWRQAVYAGILPTLFILLTLGVQIWLASRGTR
ncbi:hypothetical protein [Thermomonospora cellulosilytica]|uniref:Putative membrane protein YccC n=1 Tax=Thermomonospora cellulosilytica TaxID=1411118 RepID=A0A7W3MXD9_9ACTN|nr:hypothetical protein [Thermomonospora cellulosilytica]MBA9003655.1 putative membrane protein YccC [Thermomonospora cellulosilytica]